eukprot:7573771-Pyramimonas_sp.AAC.1
MGPEVGYRASSATATLRALRTRVFSTKALADSTCMIFADSLALPGRLHNSGVRVMLTTAEPYMADAEVMQVYRTAAKVPEAGSCISDGRVLARLRRPPPDVLRRAARLRLTLAHRGQACIFLTTGRVTRHYSAWAPRQ